MSWIQTCDYVQQRNQHVEVKKGVMLEAKCVIRTDSQIDSLVDMQRNILRLSRLCHTNLHSH